MSDAALAKGCRRAKIPVPPRGYWAKKRAGKGVRVPQLPELPPGEAEEIVITVGELSQKGCGSSQERRMGRRHPSA